MKQKPSRPTEDAQPAFGADGLLGRVVNELVARRWSAESAAHKNLQVGDRDTQRMWLARAVGLAEAVDVVQMFNEATQSNVKLSGGADNP